ncbi:MAG: PLP-dependent aminotransferase family protein [Oscillibacter sp.]|nr:PLP-dependent aminotransferase family protein [Oscillibacter sp.]
MLTYDMEARGGLPLYEYLCSCIREDILSGALPAGERLPSKRALAEHLRVSVITVEGAYQQLEAEGYLIARPRRGFFAAQVDRLSPPLSVPPELSSPPETPVWRLDLARNRMDGGLFPSAVWARLTRQVLSEGNLLAPTPHQGLLPLRQAIAENLRSFRGMAVSPDQIAVGAGAEYLYLLLAQLLGREAVFALEDPGYPKIRQVYHKWGAVCRPVPLDSQGVSPEALRASGADVLHISPAHHYPTGAITPIARRLALLRWAEETGGIIIEDDYDSELRFAGRPIPTLQSIDRRGRVVYINTFSQTISPSMRVGFMVLPPALLERWRQELGFYACTVPALEQQVLARFLAGGWYERHLSRLRKVYRTRRAAVLETFSRAFAGRASIMEQGAGLHFLLRLDTDEDDQTLRSRAEGLGVRLSFLSEYAAVQRPEYAHTLVVNYAGLDPSLLEETAALLTEAVWGTRPS